MLRALLESKFFLAALGAVAFLSCWTTSLCAADVFSAEHQYPAEWYFNFDHIVDGQFYWLEKSGEEPLNTSLRGAEALSGVRISPQFDSTQGTRGSPYVFSSYVVSTTGGIYGFTDWSVYERQTGKRLASRRLADPVVNVAIDNDILILFQNSRGGGAYLSRFSLPDMKFIDERRPPALADVHYSTLIGDEILGLRLERGSTRLVKLTLDGAEISSVLIPAACTLPCRFRDFDGKRILITFGRAYAVVDVGEMRLIRTFNLFPDAGAWATFSGNLFFIRPEKGPVEVVKTTATTIWIFDLESGRELAQTDIPPGRIKAVGDKLLLRPYVSPEIVVYGFDRSALAQ